MLDLKLKEVRLLDIQTFKNFLESITHSQGPVLQSSRTGVLLEFLKTQSLSQDDEGSPHAFDLIKTWSFAAQSNNEALFADVATVLALLLKTISHHVEFQLLGRNLCQLLLQSDQLKLLERGLSAQKSKDYQLSTCIRLLTEIVSFDGGSSARRAYRSKDVTFKRLDTNLGLRQDAKSIESGSQKRPNVRNDALRYLFVNLRLQDHAAKAEFLANGKLVRSVFQDIKEDSPSIIYEILDAVRNDILKDDKIPQRIKGRLFNDQTLGFIATLYNYDDSPVQDNESRRSRESVPATAHALLLSVCSTPEYGVLIPRRRQPAGLAGEGVAAPSDLDHQYVQTPHKPSSRPTSIKNHTLASFLQTLRPYASGFQRDLILTTFQAAPELVADYFCRKKSFAFDPKLTATWVGFAAFLLATIQLPLQDELLHLEVHGLRPPSISEVIESILPMQLSSKVTSRCLNQNVVIVKFLTIKILSAAFDKFARTISLLRSASQNFQSYQKKIWDEAASTLIENFEQRCPDMSHVITVFRSCTPQEVALREATSRLLSLYYQHLPHLALEQKFDASTPLATALDEEMSASRLSGKPSLHVLVFEHLLKIARCSPDIRWWQKAETEKLSLFGRGLQFCTMPERNTAKRSLEAILQTALSEGLSMGIEHGKELLAGLFKSLRIAKEWQPAEALFEFLDVCFTRLSKRVVKYHQDLLEQVVQTHGDSARGTVYQGGELLVVVSEQWPFIQRSATTADLENISRWFLYYLFIQEQRSKDSRLLRRIRHNVGAITIDEQCRILLDRAPAEVCNEATNYDNGELDDLATPSLETTAAQETRKTEAGSIGWEAPTPPSPENEDHPGLGRWKRFDVEEAISGGAIGELILCLCSKHVDIRKQALIELRLWMKKVETSQYSEREPIYLLFGELVETVNHSITESSLSYFAGTAAAEFCLILSNPLHYLYAKVNQFLNKGPTWKIEKLPSYWVDQILMHLPTVDDAHYKEMGWLLDLLIKGLRTAAPFHDIYKPLSEKSCVVLELHALLIPHVPSRLVLPNALNLIACPHTRNPSPYSSYTSAVRLSYLRSLDLVFHNIRRRLHTFYASLILLHMAKRYTRAELFSLRDSPLVAKPISLPSTEEWMGPPSDPNQKKVPNRGKIEELSAHDGINRRPIFERHMSRGSSNVPEDIVLGPPKTAFASAGGVRSQNRNFDSPTRPSFGTQADETARGDRQNFKDKYSRQGARYDADGEASQEFRSGNQQHRRTANEGEIWSGRQSRFSGQDENERGPRRNGHREQDRDRDVVSESRTPRGFENHRRDINDTNDPRRNGRGRNEPSWYRDEKDSELSENKRDPARAREWREKHRANARDVDIDGSRSTKQELDPEWMDEPDVQEKKQAHTQEDFERWKERMKASNGQSQENAPPAGDQRAGHERTISGISSPVGKAKAETPLVVDSSTDGFFGLWNDLGKKASSTEEPTKTEATKAKAAKSSKFTGFFGAKSAPTEQEPGAPATNPFAAPTDSSSEDKEGFQRILKLLDQQQTNPPKDAATREQTLRRNVPASPGAQVQLQQDAPNLQSLVSPRTRNGGPLPPNKDSEFLLNLMRQSRPQANTGDQRQANAIPPELLPFQNLLVSAPPGLPNLTVREEPKHHDKLNPTSVPDRKGPPPGLFDGQRPGPHDSQRMGKEGPEYAPSYISQHVPLRQGMMPPPGFQAPLRNPTQFPPGLMGNHTSAGPDPGDPFGMRANPHQAFPPPGYMNRPPPPGFPSMPPLHQNNANRMFFGGPHGPPRPPGEGFGEAGDFGIGPGQFRRQD
ncbi:MAG: hypothetical protein Q9216_000501 [Gyalolechia sp. 2 TL-2023]